MSEPEDQFKENAESVLPPYLQPQGEKEQARLERIMGKLAAHDEGWEILQFLEEKKVPVVLIKELDGVAARAGISFRAENGEITLLQGSQRIEVNVIRPDTEIAAVMLHEVRHLRQFLAGFIYPERYVSPADLAWFTRVIEADAETASVMAALRIKIAGDPSLFKAAQNSPFFYEMYRVAEEEYKKDPSSLDDGRLQRKVFDTWFDPVYARGKGVYDEQVVFEQWPFFKMRMEFCASTPETAAPLTAAEITGIGVCGGEEINYLTLPGFRPIDDPYYKADFSFFHLQKIDELTKEWRGEKRDWPILPPKSAAGPSI